MWIRSIRWRDREQPERSFRGRYRPQPDSDDIDTSDLDAVALSRLLPATKHQLADHGDLILEVVLRGEELPEDLKEILDVAAPGGEETIASYVELEQPIPTIYQAEVGKGGKTVWGAHMRAFPAPEFGFDERDGSKPRLVGRVVRTVDTSSLLLVFWRGRWAFPEMPSARGDAAYQPAGEFPGTIIPSNSIQDEIDRGVPEALARIATEWGAVGPSTFDAAVAAFDTDEEVGPQQVGEAWFSSLASNLLDISDEGLSIAFRAWDQDLLERMKDIKTPVGAEAERLAELGGMVSLLRDAHQEMSEPYDHAVPYWFAETEESAKIEETLHRAEASLERAEVRLRDSLALASTVISSGALRLQQHNQLRGERLQRTVTSIGALVLGPTLVAGIFGANVPLPLGETWWGFALMVVLALLSAGLIYLALNRLTKEP